MPPSQNTPADLAAAQVMTGEKSTFMSDGLAEAGVNMADMDRGFTKESLKEDYSTDPDGTNQVGDPYSRPGFAGPTSKYKRL